MNASMQGRQSPALMGCVRDVGRGTEGGSAAGCAQPTSACGKPWQPAEAAAHVLGAGLHPYLQRPVVWRLGRPLGRRRRRRRRRGRVAAALELLLQELLGLPQQPLPLLVLPRAVLGLLVLRRRGSDGRR